MRRSCLAVLVIAALAACTSPAPVLYTISPVNGAPVAGGPKVVLLEQVVLATFLQRQQIVRSSENNRLDVMSNDWWGEKLEDMIGRVLVDELSQRLPSSTVLSEHGGITVTPDATVELSIQRLDKDAAGNVVLQAQAGVALKGPGAAAVRAFRFSVPPTGADTQAEVAAISAALGQLADGLAAMLAAGRPPK
jgi:uncharacterized lipoprotein YmbA